MEASAPNAENDAGRAKPARKRRRFWLLAVLGVVGGAEGFARWGLGLGDPPLMMAHPTIEYLAKPNQDCLRFGNRLIYNAHSMRSEASWGPRESEGQLRVLVLGDSVINGGNLTDQSELATTLLQNHLRAEGHTDAIVGNVSAGSWSPINTLAYCREYGLFDADLVLVVVNSDDAEDRFRGSGLDPTTQPEHAPWSAFAEGVSRYLLPRLRSNPAPASTPADDPEDTDETDAMAALRDLLTLIRDEGATPIVVHHCAKTALTEEQEPGLKLLAEVAERLGAAQLSDKEALRTASQTGAPVYRDTLHPTAEGQSVLCEVFHTAIRPYLGDSSHKPESGTPSADAQHRSEAHK